MKQQQIVRTSPDVIKFVSDLFSSFPLGTMIHIHFGSIKTKRFCLQWNCMVLNLFTYMDNVQGVSPANIRNSLRKRFLEIPNDTIEYRTIDGFYLFIYLFIHVVCTFTQINFLPIFK